MFDNPFVRATSIILSIALTVVVIAQSLAVGFLLHNNDQLTSRINSSVVAVTDKQCDFYKLVSSLPVTSATTKVGVELIGDSRMVYKGLNCQGQLPVPSAELVKLANQFNIKLS
jgi:hypothetical protein